MNKLLNAQDANGETPLFYAVRATPKDLDKIKREKTMIQKKRKENI